MLKGIGLFKLAASLVVIASVLFLVPGLKLLSPGFEEIGTIQSQAMPSSDAQLRENTSIPNEVEKAKTLDGLDVTDLGAGDFSSILSKLDKMLSDSQSDAADIPSGDLPGFDPFVDGGGLSD